MSRIALVIAFFLLSIPSIIFSQRDSADIQVDQMPYFRGCHHLANGSVEKRNCSNKTLVNFISKNLETPPNSDVIGTVYISFTINEKGDVENPKILRGLETPQNEAALAIVKNMPAWEPALLNGNPIKMTMTLPIRFTQKDETVFSNGFQLTWGNLKGQNISKSDIVQGLYIPVSVRDESGNLLEVNELLLEREREGKYLEAQSNGKVSGDMEKIVKKLKTGDVVTITATVQKKGQFYYVDKVFTITP